VKQVVQDIRSGAVQVLEVPEPQPREGYVLVAVAHSLISSGTERASVDMGSKSLLQKARARPDLVRKTVDVARAEGVGAAMARVRSRLDQYTELGYSVAGRVLDTGGDPRLVPGALVACAGQGYASHADVISAPANLVVPLPEGVATADAACSAPAAIALHALRLAEVQPGAVVAVVGLGLIGQLAGRLVAAAGCIPVGTDPREERRARFGDAAPAEGIGALVELRSRGRGADAVLVCAATPSSGPVELAAGLARDRARVVVVGDVGLELDRRVFYEKELSLVVARSYGAGRYERAYEERGLDFPVGYVRWTEGRNIEAVLDLLGRGSLEVADLVTHSFPVASGEQAYATLREDPAALGILLEFDPGEERRAVVRVTERPPREGALRVGLVGAGSFARGTLIPALKELEGVELAAACARSGASARSLADRFEIPLATTDWRALAAGDEVDALVIATPHAEHAEMAAAGLEAGKAVFVEKPLAIDWEGLRRVRAAAGDGLLLVGHNRRFAPLARRLRDAVEGPLAIQIRVAAGVLPPGHWVEDPEQGGRVLGEISHFVDLASFLAGEPPAFVSASSVGGSLLATLRFAGGSAASIAYGVGESGRLPKERVEVLGAAGAGVLEDFQRLELHGAVTAAEKSRRDKGHREQLAAFVAAARGIAPAPVPLEEQLLVAAASLALLDAARTGETIAVSLPA
jgi:predicted dehydrogenase/threonine dehydrogenase-like Zn-dependent dehydrogenase